jgi:hypothetical protein
MENEGQSKEAAQQFIQQLRSKCKDIKLFKAALKEFASDSFENRVVVAMGFLAIGADRSENTLYRNVMLSQLGLFVRACGLRNNKDLERQLKEVIDDWITTVPDQDFYTAPWGALFALGNVNRGAGLEKCDYVIKFYGESEAGRKVSEVRMGIEQFNPLEP